MLIVAPVLEARRLPFERTTDMDAYDIVRRPRSDVPAITHIDYSARIQTIARPDHPEYYDVVAAFGDRTSTPLVVNTSFNVRGEPIVCTPYHAYSCFMRTEMDVLVMGNHVLYKAAQPGWHEAMGHIEENDESDVAVDETPLVTAVREAFHTDFVPAMARLRGMGIATDRIHTRPSGSTWIDVEQRQHDFRIPTSLLLAGRSAAQRARDICSFWQVGTVTERLEPVVERLLEIGDANVKTSTSDPTVSENIYVLY